MIRSRLRNAAHAFLCQIGLPSIARSLQRASGAVLAFHNVVPDDLPSTGDSSLHIRCSDFTSLIDVIREMGPIVPLEEVTPPSRRSGEFRFSITFDDAYHGVIENALPTLSERGAPATIFVAPGLLGTGVPWWDHLACQKGDAIPSSLREDVLHATDGGTGTGIDRSLVFPPSFAIASESLIKAVAEQEGISLGAHSWTHANLAANLSRVRLEHELRAPLEWLQTVRGNTVPYVAYPYGRYSPRVASQARRFGYTAGFAIAGGLITDASGSFSLERINVPRGLTPNGLRLRTAGLLR